MYRRNSGNITNNFYYGITSVDQLHFAYMKLLLLFAWFHIHFLLSSHLLLALSFVSTFSFRYFHTLFLATLNISSTDILWIKDFRSVQWLKASEVQAVASIRTSDRLELYINLKWMDWFLNKFQKKTYPSFSRK